MPIPAFNSDLIIQPYIHNPTATGDRSPYRSSMVELVNRFNFNASRRVLLENLLKYRQIMYQDDYADGIQFIDGSFVEDVETDRGRPPADIDVFSFLQIPQKYKNDFKLWQSSGHSYFVSNIHSRSNKTSLQLDTYAIIVEDLFSNTEDCIAAICYWSSLFGHRRRDERWKGFVMIPLDPINDQIASSQLGAP